MRIKTVFVAYPYKIGESYREALRNRFDGTGIEFRYADERLENAHVMDKILRMMSEADVSFFDVTGCNPNVMLELGYALGAEQPGFVVVQEDAVSEISADITGWDQLRYKDIADLADKLHERITNARVPQRVRVPSEQDRRDPLRDAARILRELRFGIPQVEAPLLCVYCIPLEYRRHYIDRKSLGKQHPYRASDLCDSVLAGPNRTGYRTFFWPGGFDYSEHPGPDFIEVYEGRSIGPQSDRITNFRVYTSGAVTYMQRLREGGADYKPFLYVDMFQNIVEMALIAIADIRTKLGFADQDDVAVGAVFLNAEDLRVSAATPGFYPEGDAGLGLINESAEVWIPDTPLQAAGQDLGSSALDLADEIAAYLRTKVE